MWAKRRGSIWAAQPVTTMRAGMVAPQLADGLRGLAHGLGGHGAGVDDQRVGETGCRGVACHHLRFEGIEPTAERDDAHGHPSPLWGGAGGGGNPAP
jgi:hypothetical protein